ncbi:Platelet-activating factor acetylhydrolase IB subunit gamma [Seminavis robusta]|uniref:Platelet-activating factor acetylhydrolase IB subunit gamma n=1 Tax=Seminavis robusta TaxID=568900 RepID=A0A9N8EAD7_9STRA|nr:Platelet-activating factor acetylhydrolase IB subunit gamma [Seminavis robusta]|eukprot:Sro725_g193280.1 Platelet-activating factor acetylhydrolase IB subunit gamma (827) ;mRNA; r:12842-15423
MFPVSSFEDEEDALPSIPEPNLHGEYDEGEPPAQATSPLGNTRAEYNGIYTSSGNTGLGVMNLKELDAYVHDTVRAQRRQRRKEILIKLALSIGFVVIATAVLSSSVFVYEEHSSSNKSLQENEKAIDKSIHFHNPIGYELSQCEFELNQNRSFLQLIAETQVIEDESACRREVPDCDWENPTIPAKRHDDNSALRAEWNYAFEFNVRHIRGVTKRVTTETNPFDVVLIGDSIVEHWEGKDMGMNEPSLHRDHEVFEELFTKHGGGQIDGMAHGIGGDRCANLLWRLENGEMPPEFQPKVWWLLIGTEDWHVGVDSEAIVAGIIKIVMTIRQAHPSTHIVINSILPRGNEKRDDNPHYAALFDINQRLDCYVESENERRKQKLAQAEITPSKHEMLSFFNATAIFLFRDPEVGYFVNPALLPDYVHPSAQGEEIWGQQIVAKVLELTGGVPYAEDGTEDAIQSDAGTTTESTGLQLPAVITGTESPAVVTTAKIPNTNATGIAPASTNRPVPPAGTTNPVSFVTPAAATVPPATNGIVTPAVTPAVTSSAEATASAQAAIGTIPPVDTVPPATAGTVPPLVTSSAEATARLKPPLVPSHLLAPFLQPLLELFLHLSPAALKPPQVLKPPLVPSHLLHVPPATTGTVPPLVTSSVQAATGTQATSGTIQPVATVASATAGTVPPVVTSSVEATTSTQATSGTIQPVATVASATAGTVPPVVTSATTGTVPPVVTSTELATNTQAANGIVPPAVTSTPATVGTQETVGSVPPAGTEATIGTVPPVVTTGIQETVGTVPPVITSAEASTGTQGATGSVPPAATAPHEQP